MAIKKKSKETLEQQKNSFLNFAGTQKKYESIIAELFLMDNEKIDDIEYIKSYLAWKWFDKDLIDNFEGDYKKYLWGRYFYWPIDQYPPELQTKIIKNNKILEKLKKEIMEDYKKINDFELIVSEKKFNEFLLNELDFDNIKFESRKIYQDIPILDHELKEKNEELELKETALKEAEIQLKNCKLFEFSKKKLLKQNLDNLNKEFNLLKIEKDKILEKYNELSGVRDLLDDINKVRGSRNFRLNDSWYDWRDVFFKSFWSKFDEQKKIIIDGIKFSESWENNYLEFWKGYLSSLKEKIKLYSMYMNKKDFNQYILGPIMLNKVDAKELSFVKNIRDKVNKYLNYFFFWEDKKVECLWGGICPTVFSYEKIDDGILNIVNSLTNYRWWFDIQWIDERFVDDIFVHRSNFRVLDEILQEWGLISHNEIINRRWNQDIALSNNNHEAQHKDIYFSRGFNSAWYWWNSGPNDIDVMFCVNTMNNFALNGYWIPLNLSMQPNTTIENNQFTSDAAGFSVISKSSLWRYDYWKIDVKDLYIFVSEYKKSEIENNSSKYNTENAHIIYIPKEYYSSKGYTYKIYEFIEQQMQQFKQRKKIFPYKVVSNKVDFMGSISDDYSWAFCDIVWDEENENNIPSLLWDWSIDSIISLLKKCSSKEDEWFIVSIEQWLKNTSYDDLSILSCFSAELLKLAYSYLKIDYNHRPKIRNITKILSKSWYSQKEIAIFYEIVSFINASYEKQYKNLQCFCDAFSLKYEDIETIIKLLSQKLWFYGVSNRLVKSKEVYSK